ncbi:M23 family metallopeptidase [uncultured Brevundimonas sp.]|uniref:M23 family metallopeptidase n=1 Tax=uncultured Brevundimonas sp. TaxID=213418 RepID=UPI0030EC19EC|tara:strand:- start:18471 stop:19097 length:627 start_codon:yes stop_codon:yes gene_type:complete
MRSLLPTARSILIHTGQTAILAGMAVLAMAAAPMSAPVGDAAAIATETPALAPIQAVAEPAGPVTRKLLFSAPVRGYGVNSPFGLRKLAGEARARAHKGVDIAAPKGTGVQVAAEGRVLRTGYDASGFGNFIEVSHPNGMTSLYGHLSRIDVASGMTVEQGQRIGLVGSTGYSTGPHLHFQIERSGRMVDPSRVVGRSFDVVVKAAKA